MAEFSKFQWSMWLRAESYLKCMYSNLYSVSPSVTPSVCLSMDHWLWMVQSFKKFQNTIFSRYQKMLSSGNSNGSKTSPKFFSYSFFNKYTRGVQSFCKLQGATNPLIEQWLKCFQQFTPNMWWTNTENLKTISGFGFFAIIGLLLYKLAYFVRE